MAARLAGVWRSVCASNNFLITSRTILKRFSNGVPLSDVAKQKSKSNCDIDFYECMKDSCKKERFIRKALCQDKAEVYYLGVKGFGNHYYKKGRRGCSNCP